MIAELIKKTRSVRRYQEDRPLALPRLKGLVDLARIGGSARNGQVLKYLVVTGQALRQRIFPFLGWAGYLEDWPGPIPGERPPAYIICLVDTSLLRGGEFEAYCDLGIATQDILLGAAEQGVSGCRIGAFSPQLHALLGLAEQYRVLQVIALGYPAETVILEAIDANGDVRYWRDEQGRHHVPKRSIDEVLLGTLEDA